MMRILAVDPGPLKSAWLMVEPGEPMRGVQQEDNEAVLGIIEAVCNPTTMLAVEYMHSMGMPQSQGVLDAQYWVGRFADRACTHGAAVAHMKRRDVKLYICGNARAKDANVRQALIDRYPPTGGGSVPQIGTKKAPGPLYGMATHLWSCLAIALTAQHEREGDENTDSG